MTNRERVIEFLHSIAPKDASNSEIVAHTGIKPHTQVFMITRELMQTGMVKGLQAGHEWRFWIGEGSRESRPVLSENGNQCEPYEWDTIEVSECRLGMTWKSIGRVLLRGNRIVVPAAPALPAIYRFRIRARDSESAYIGETENLARRLMFYSNPGPTQQTNLRINSEFRRSLSASAEVGVSVVLEDAWIELRGRRVGADLSQRAVRCLFENAAIAEGLGTAVEYLNK